MKRLYSMSVDLGRNGTLEGLFIAESGEVDGLIDQWIHFGEVLGKHSKITVLMRPQDIIERSDDQELIAKLEGIFGGPCLCGHNPLDYVDEELDDGA